MEFSFIVDTKNLCRRNNSATDRENDRNPENIFSFQLISGAPILSELVTKSSLMRLGLDICPITFELPFDGQRFSNFTKQHPEAHFITKGADHRGIEYDSIEELQF